MFIAPLSAKLTTLITFTTLYIANEEVDAEFGEKDILTVDGMIALALRYL